MKPSRRRAAAVVAGAAILACVAAGIVAWRHEFGASIDLGAVPYAQSQSCEPCHADHHASWARTFHRTMTQEAGAGSVLGDFEDAAYVYDGVTSRFTRDGDRYAIETLAPDGAMRRFEIAMTVGSRRVQQYVARDGDRFYRLPLAWDVGEGRWFHLAGGFLHPDGSDFNTHTALWNANCVFCHNVKANPGFDFSTQRFETRVAELGIACEACHGPGGEHVRRNANPVRRYLMSRFARHDPTIFSPLEMTKERQVQLCGHCHGQRLPEPLERIDEFATRGDPYTAGDDLAAVTRPIVADTRLDETDFSTRFWKDGTPRLTAYEYQGLLMSKDYQHGDLTCISCHSMHGGDPKGMIEPEMRTSEACRPCHEDLFRDVRAHTKHDPDGSGSDCYACHMPRIVYGILDVHPSHRITNPDPARAWRHDMPDACTLCHVDETAGWAARALAEQHGSAAPGDIPDGPTWSVAESLRGLLGGDVVRRAVAAMALSDSTGVEDDPAARLWAAPFLMEAMRDRYPAIRRFAARGLASLAARAAAGDPAAALEVARLPRFDPLAEPAARDTTLALWSAWWERLDKSRLPRPGDAVPLDADWRPIPSVLRTLEEGRDETIIAIGE